MLLLSKSAKILTQTVFSMDNVLAVSKEKC